MAVRIHFCIIYVMNASAVLVRLALNGLQHCGERLVATMQYNFWGTPKFHVNYHWILLLWCTLWYDRISHLS